MAIRFETPQRVKLWIVVTDIEIDCSELRVSLEEPTAFIKAINEIRRSF